MNRIAITLTIFVALVCCIGCDPLTSVEVTLTVSDVVSGNPVADLEAQLFIDGREIDNDNQSAGLESTTDAQGQAKFGFGVVAPSGGCTLEHASIRNSWSIRISDGHTSEKLTIIPNSDGLLVLGDYLEQSGQSESFVVTVSEIKCLGIE